MAIRNYGPKLVKFHLLVDSFEFRNVIELTDSAWTHHEMGVKRAAKVVFIALGTELISVNS